MDYEDYDLTGIVGKLRLLHRHLETLPRNEARAIIDEAIERMERIRIKDEDQFPFVFQIKMDGRVTGDLAIGTEQNLFEALLKLDISREEAEAACTTVVSVLQDDLVPIHKGSNFKVTARRWLFY
jgi:hypothetical protein